MPLAPAASAQAGAIQAPVMLLQPPDGGVPIQVTGVAVEMILALATHADELAQVAKGTVELHWGPNGVSGRVIRLWEERVSPALIADFQPDASPAASPAASATSAPHVRRGSAPVRRGASAVRRMPNAALLIVGTERIGQRPTPTTT